MVDAHTKLFFRRNLQQQLQAEQLISYDLEVLFDLQVLLEATDN